MISIPLWLFIVLIIATTPWVLLLIAWLVSWIVCLAVDKKQDNNCPYEIDKDEEI